MRTLGSMLLFQTLVPNQDPCASGADYWLYAIDPTTGGRTQHPVFKDLETDSADDKAEDVSAIEFGGENEFSISRSETGFTVYAPDDEESIQLPRSAQGRQTWRLVPD